MPPAFLLAAPGPADTPAGLDPGAGRQRGRARLAGARRTAASPNRSSSCARCSPQRRGARLLLWRRRAADAGPAPGAALARRRRADPDRRAGRRMLAVFERVAPAGTSRSGRSGVPASIPRCSSPICTSRRRRRAAACPGTAAFWNAGVRRRPDPDRERGAIAGRAARRLHVALRADLHRRPGGRPRALQQVLFASRRVDVAHRPTSRATRSIATRAVAQYPALVGALERARITSIPVYAAAARRARRRSPTSTTSGARPSTLAQFQGALAIVARALARGSIDHTAGRRT